MRRCDSTPSLHKARGEVSQIVVQITTFCGKKGRQYYIVCFSSWQNPIKTTILILGKRGNSQSHSSHLPHRQVPFCNEWCSWA
jgi:hypothetical protein